MRDLNWAQQFALHNRNEMMDRVLSEVSYAVYGEDGHQAEIEVQRINSHHNFTQQESHFGHTVWVTRKGAIEARRHNWAMIPGSMGTRSYIVVGKEHPMSFYSAPHGAGRRYSRTKARALFKMEDLSQAMQGDRVPALEGTARRDPRRVQGHRPGDGEREGPGRDEVHPQAVHQRQRRLIDATTWAVSSKCPSGFPLPRELHHGE